jgi:putative DNA primase/helicase
VAEAAREAAIALSGGDSNTEERAVELLHDIKVEFDERGQPAITTKTLIGALCADEERPWATYNRGQCITDRQLAKLLKPFAIISENLWPSETGEAQAKGYRRAHFDDAFDRYLTPTIDASCPTRGSQASVRPDADGMGTTSDFSIRPESSPDGCEKCEKPANDGGSDARTDKNPKPSHEGNGGDGAAQFRSDVADAYEELRLRGETTDDDVLDIPAFLRRGTCP